LQRSYLLLFVLYLVLAVAVTVLSLLSPAGPWQHKETGPGPLPTGSFPAQCMFSSEKHMSKSGSYS